MIETDYSTALGVHQETVSERLEAAIALVRTLSKVSAQPRLDANDGVKRQLAAALDLVYRAVEIIRVFEERTAENELEAQEFERSTRELMQRTLEESKLQRARCQELEVRLSEADARAQEAERRACLAEAQVAEAHARALSAEALAAEAETRSKQFDRWRARLHDALQEVPKPLAAAAA
jgi:hypothetical protein